MTQNNLLMTATIKDIKTFPPKSCRMPEEYETVIPIISQKYDYEYIEGG